MSGGQYEKTLARVLALATHAAGRERTPPAPDGHTPLMHGGFWLDSVGMLELVVACEQEFGITFDEGAELNGRALEHVAGLTELILKRVAERDASRGVT